MRLRRKHFMILTTKVGLKVMRWSSSCQAEELCMNSGEKWALTVIVVGAARKDLKEGRKGKRG